MIGAADKDKFLPVFRHLVGTFQLTLASCLGECPVKFGILPQQLPNRLMFGRHFSLPRKQQRKRSTLRDQPSLLIPPLRGATLFGSRLLGHVD